MVSSPSLTQRRNSSVEALGDSVTKPPTLVGNGNNPAQRPLGTTTSLFTYAGQSETIYATTTVDANAAGTTTIDCWAQVRGSNFIHATREVVVSGQPSSGTEDTGDLDSQRRNVPGHPKHARCDAALCLDAICVRGFARGTRSAVPCLSR